MKIIKKTAGFWIRVLSILIDLILFCGIAIPLSLIAINQSTETLNIITWGYYVWMSLIIFEILILFIGIPILLKGRTIGMLICRINLISLNEENPVWLMVLKKNQFYGFLWIFSILISMSFISPSLAQKMSDISNQQDGKIELEPWEAALIAIPSTTSGIIIFLNMLSIISINMNKNMYSIVDKMINTKMIYLNKDVEVFDETNKFLKKEKTIKQKLIWKD